MTFSREQLLLYAITDAKADNGRLVYERVERALMGGAAMIQLREKELGKEEIISVAKRLLPICHSYEAPLIINDDPFIAAESGADGVHVGLSDMSAKEVRNRFGQELIVGVTAKTVAQAKSAEEQGADYIGVGAVFPSPTKENAVRITYRELCEITASVSIPSVAIGGITEQNALSLKNSGISGIAVVSALFKAQDITNAARRLKLTAEELVG